MHHLANRRRIIGLAGAAGAGKDTVANLIPGARRVGFADPLYEGLSALLGLPESILRDRRTKELPIAGLGRSPRELLQTLGTDWGREMVAPDVWLRIAYWRWERAAAEGAAVIAVPDVRFANEAQAIREQGGEVWLVHRPDVAPVEAHASEAGLPLGLIDRLIANTGTVDQLRERVETTFAR